MTSIVKVSNITSETGQSGAFRNIVPERGSLYASDVNVYTKLVTGNDDDNLRPASAESQGLKWEKYIATIPYQVFPIQSCISFIERSPKRYAFFGMTTPLNSHKKVDTMIFDNNIEIFAIGMRPRGTNEYPTNEVSTWGDWTGTLDFNIVTCSDSTKPKSGNMVPVAVPASPHLTVDGGDVGDFTSVTNIFDPVIPIPANTKFSIQTRFRGDGVGSGSDSDSGSDDDDDMHSLTAVLWCKGPFYP